MSRPSPFHGEAGKVRNRRVSPIGRCRTDGPLSDRRAGDQPARRELVFMVESECDAGGFRSTLSVAAPFVWRCLTRLPVAPVSTPTGSPEAVTRPRFPQNVACGFPAPTLFGSWFTALRAPAAPSMGGAV
jgi:hypothetical protein